MNNLSILKSLSLTFAAAMILVSCEGAGEEVKPSVEPQPTPPEEEVPPVPTEPEVPVVEVPKADLLDLEFYNDGSVKDISGGGMTIANVAGAPMVNYYNDQYSKYVAHFNHRLGTSAASGYVKADYSASQTVKNKLSDGHSLECLFRMDKVSDGSAEVKMFSAMQSGGTGFLITNSARGTQITFLPNISTTGKSNWVWTTSNIVPEAGRYYHVVGVWNKSEQKSYIYVDGELKGTADAPGDMVFPSSSSCHWFGVGGDASTSNATNAWNGDVAIARVYDDPLTAEQAAALYSKVESSSPKQEIIEIEDLSFLGECNIKPLYRYNVYGTGFRSGDALRLESCEDRNTVFNPSSKVYSDHLSITVPSELKDGLYRLMLVRGGAAYPLGSAMMRIADGYVATGTQVVAHRALHNTGAPENSIEAIQKAQKLEGLYASEIDVWVTTDGEVVVNHDKSFPTDPLSHVIQNSSFSDLSAVRLSNGESVPRLKDVLEEIRKGDMKLVIEIKSHADDAKNFRCVDSCMAQVTRYGLDDKVDWIAFSYENCKRIAAARPKAIVQYLNGDKAPSVCAADKIKGIDYKMEKLKDEWITEAHSLGMVVNVWTVNSDADMLTYISKGVDFITTNNPQNCISLLSKKYIELPE